MDYYMVKCENVIYVWRMNRKKKMNRGGGE